MDSKKLEAYFGLTVGIIFILVGLSLPATGIFDEFGANADYCYLGLIVFGIISVVFGLYDYQRLERKKDGSKSRYCPDCGRAIPFDANICPYCGKKFWGNKNGKEISIANSRLGC